MEAIARSRRWQLADALYAYYSAGPALEVYGRRLGLGAWQLGECHREEPRAYFREIDALRGRPRVWFFYTHAALGYREPEVIKSYLDRIGRVLDSIPDPHGLRGQQAAPRISTISRHRARPPSPLRTTSTRGSTTVSRASSAMVPGCLRRTSLAPGERAESSRLTSAMISAGHGYWR